ncbi:YebC/PmpR family DNA-binding transcriptional regulator [Candidatus Roizmanbacteria bacterium CG10_big_fil_rev_8_21_14_0_10_39_6]|uniref:Probable transcriptional regulatory protein COU88_03205 n=1 Tax=Candidatus Roizmanbacteria bacterium CG10_big_fil_rev_8_21_14_0_10_39_6 TaxID=1974853 RepID=A0A2M8KS69_9BACT|nr:MAG: YebC/PmpR family DNA-binding transcriptional regulator [Candidatus Roizmanbacteria bacterium CG10_big_fil_rev_8_21_14_0_10_39_6]
MSGHSHWATIKRKKESVDQQKGKAFARANKDILFAIKEGGNIVDPSINAYLRTAIEKAKEVNLPKENIQRILDKSLHKESLSEAIYEGIGPGRSAFLIHVATDNTNRALGEVRLVFNKAQSKLGEKGAVSYLFNKSGVLTTGNTVDENTAFLLADAVHANDIEKGEISHEIIVPYETTSEALRKAEEMKISVAVSIEYRPINPLTLTQSDYERACRILENLEELDDVQNVFVNFTFHE